MAQLAIAIAIGSGHGLAAARSLCVILAFALGVLIGKAVGQTPHQLPTLELACHAIVALLESACSVSALGVSGILGAYCYAHSISGLVAGASIDRPRGAGASGAGAGRPHAPSLASAAPARPAATEFDPFARSRRALTRAASSS